MYCAIIGDLVNSRTLPASERQATQTRLKIVLHEVDEKWQTSVAARFIITLGDEFQGLLHTVSPAIEIATYILDRLYPQQVRFGIGYGELHTTINPDMALGADGPAFHLARSGLDELKASSGKESGFLVRIRTQSPDERLLNLICDDINHLRASWTEKQRNIIRAAQAENIPQNVLAQRLGLNPSTITRHLQASRHTHYRNCLEEMTAYLCSQYDNHFLTETNLKNQ